MWRACNPRRDESRGWTRVSGGHLRRQAQAALPTGQCRGRERGSAWTRILPISSSGPPARGKTLVDQDQTLFQVLVEDARLGHHLLVAGANLVAQGGDDAFIAGADLLTQSGDDTLVAGADLLTQGGDDTLVAGADLLTQAGDDTLVAGADLLTQAGDDTLVAGADLLT